MTGNTSFVGLASSVLSTTVTTGTRALSRIGTLGINRSSTRTTIARHSNVANRGVRLSNCYILRNSGVRICSRVGGRALYAVIRLGRGGTRTNRGMTVRMTTVHPMTLSRSSISRRAGGARLRITITGAGRRLMRGTIGTTLGGTNVGPTRISSRSRVRDGAGGN